MEQSFGMWLRRTRRARGLSQQELAAQTGIIGSTLSLMEGGNRFPTTDQAARLASTLGLDLTELLARLVKERLLRTEEGRIFLAEARAGRFYDDGDEGS